MTFSSSTSSSSPSTTAACLLPPSQRLEPEYIEVATAFAGDGTTVVAKLDADEHKELAARYGIKGYPTLKLFRSVL